MDNWMLPAVRAEAVGLVADELADLMPGRADELRRRATQRRDLIRAHAEAVRDRFAAAGVAGVPVLANVMQAPFVEWAGFDVRGTFAGGQELSVAELERLVALAAEDGVVLVIDNLQSGDTAASATLAEETGATRVVLSNFPGAFAESARWEDEVDANVDRLLAALEDAGHG
jgi:zinc/manganese transport system substrate-binding protein/zinc transport system substrate-binding protein